MSDVERLRAALQAIVDYEPDAPWPPLDNEDCVECAEWRARQHPIQNMCERHVRAFYARQDHNERVRATQHYELRRIAREALQAPSG